MGILKNIEWLDSSKDILVYKIDCSQNHINRGSVLTVRESQVAIFCDMGKIADVFLPGRYTLDTNNIPVLTKLMSWKYGFETPFKSDVFFVNTKQFVNQKWGTTNPIMLRDKDYGAIRVRGFGTFSFRVKDAAVFMKEIFGTGKSYKTDDINEYLRSHLITAFTDALGESKVPILDLAANLNELGKNVEKSIQEDFLQMGLELVKFNVQNFSLPEELEKALDKSTSLGMMKNNVDTYQKIAAADALKDAAKNPGMAGSTMGAGMGMGMGLGMGNMFGNAFQQTQQSTGGAAADTAKCPKCGAAMKANAKFCPECGAANGNVCSKCKALVPANSKFCPDCGNSMVKQCPKCKATLADGAKFCPECGERL